MVGAMKKALAKASAFFNEFCLRQVKWLRREIFASQM